MRGGWKTSAARRTGRLPGPSADRRPESRPGNVGAGVTLAQPSWVGTGGAGGVKGMDGNLAEQCGPWQGAWGASAGAVGFVGMAAWRPPGSSPSPHEARAALGAPSHASERARATPAVQRTGIRRLHGTMQNSEDRPRV